MDRVQVLAIVGTVLVFGVVLELVRRRRLVERYALLWLVTAVVLLVLAIWRDLLDQIAKAANIDSGPNALFLAAFGLVFLLLLHFSVAISRLSEETKILAQEQARLDAEVRQLRAERNGSDPAAVPPALASVAGGEQDPNDPPVRP
jgi:hypothetical protein